MLAARDMRGAVKVGPPVGSWVSKVRVPTGLVDIGGGASETDYESESVRVRAGRVLRRVEVLQRVPWAMSEPLPGTVQ